MPRPTRRSERRFGPESPYSVRDLADRAGRRVAAIGMDRDWWTSRAELRSFLPNLPTQWSGRTLCRPSRDARYSCSTTPQPWPPLGEFTYGHGRSVGSMIFLTVGAGIGGGISITSCVSGPDGQGDRRQEPSRATAEVPLRPWGLSRNPGQRPRADQQSIQAPALWPRGGAPQTTRRERGGSDSQGDGRLRLRAATRRLAGIARAAAYLGPRRSQCGNPPCVPDMVVLGGSVAALAFVCSIHPGRAGPRKCAHVSVDEVTIERSILEDKAGLQAASRWPQFAATRAIGVHLPHRPKAVTCISTRVHVSDKASQPSVGMSADAAGKGNLAAPEHL